MNFENDVRALMGQYNQDLKTLTFDSTERIFYLRKKQNNELKSISINKMIIGRFYLIKYNYNGNKIFCPILPLEYKVIKNKNILYCINLDYLPYTYKVDFFSKLFSFYNDVLDKNKDIADVISELPLKGINFESIYNLLKNNGGYEYCVTAFDILKIKEIYQISTNIVHRFIFLNTKLVNSAMMKQLILSPEFEQYKEELKIIIEKYDNLIISYDNDVKEYYKVLKTFEKNYKILDS